MSAPQQGHEEKLKVKPSGRPLQFSKAGVKTVAGQNVKLAKPSNFHNKPKFSRVTHQKLPNGATAAPAFKNPMPRAKQPTKSKLGKVNQQA